MSFDFSSSLGRLTDLYLDNSAAASSIDSNLKLGEEAKGKFGQQFAEVYDSMQAMRMLDDTMRSKYETDHRDDMKTDLNQKSSAMTFAKGSSRILDMLTEQISDSMNTKVNTAMSNALKYL